MTTKSSNLTLMVNVKVLSAHPFVLFFFSLKIITTCTACEKHARGSPHYHSCISAGAVQLSCFCFLSWQAGLRPSSWLVCDVFLHVSHNGIPVDCMLLFCVCSVVPSTLLVYLNAFSYWFSFNSATFVQNKVQLSAWHLSSRHFVFVVGLGILHCSGT